MGSRPIRGVTDDAVPAVALLLGDDGPALVESVIGTAGGTMRSVRVSQVRYSPGRSVVVQFRAGTSWPSARDTTEIVVAAAGIDTPDGVPIVSDGEVEIALWRFPNDPFLPGLAPATDPERVSRLLVDLGAPRAPAKLRTRAYRPGRRAVVEAVTPTARLFLKLLRPAKIETLQKRHVAMAKALPVPHSLGWASELGLVALQAMPGRTLRKSLEAGSRKLPTGQQHLELLAALPDLGDDAATRRPLWERARDHAKLLSAVLPEDAAQIGDTAARIADVTIDTAEVPVHGDYHSSQLLVKQSEILGLIDVDTAGVGHRAEDLAGLVGHLSTVALASPARKNVDRHGRELLRVFDSHVDPGLLRQLTAAVVFGLATGPFRVQEQRWPEATRRRLQLAEQWLDAQPAT